MRGIISNIILAFVVLLLLSVMLFSCSPARKLNKAKSDFGKAVTSYPEIGAEYCTITYPVRTIKGKDSITVDTLWGSGETHFDTVYSLRRDTVRITKYLPGNTIRETILRVDTVVNTAEIAACRLQQGKIVDLLTDKTVEADNLKDGRNMWRKIAIGLMATMALGLFFAIRRKIVKKILI